MSKMPDSLKIRWSDDVELFVGTPMSVFPKEEKTYLSLDILKTEVKNRWRRLLCCEPNKEPFIPTADHTFMKIITREKAMAYQEFLSLLNEMAGER